MEQTFKKTGDQLELFLPRESPIADGLPTDPTERMRFLMYNPRARLEIAAEGLGPLDLDDVVGIIGDHLLALDRASKELERLTTEWMSFVFAGGNPQPEDLNSILDDPPTTSSCARPDLGLDIAERLVKLHSLRLQELRRTVALISRITTPQPRVRVRAATAAGMTGLSVDLGGDE